MNNLQKIFVLTLITFLLVSCSQNQQPITHLRPAGVPLSAVWAGGVDGGSFIDCDSDAQARYNRCLIYNETTGDVEGGGDFVLRGSGRAANKTELKYDGSDNVRIYLQGGKILEPISVIRPPGIPSDAAFAVGLFISCRIDQSTNSNPCSFFRPDGTLYFAGQFQLSGKKRAATRVELSYKFFSLSDREVFLNGGGSLVEGKLGAAR